MANTTISTVGDTAGTFSTGSSASAALGNFVVITNQTQAGISGVVTPTRGGNAIPADAFNVDLEPGATFIFRNNIAATTWAYAGEVKHTYVKARLAPEHTSSAVDELAGSASAGPLVSPAQALVLINTLA